MSKMPYWVNTTPKRFVMGKPSNDDRYTWNSFSTSKRAYLPFGIYSQFFFFSLDCSQLFEPTSSMPPPPPADFDTQWQTSLSQSEPSIQSRTNRYQSSSYKVSIGHETVNITEIAQERKSSLEQMDKRRMIPIRRNINILSLCFMCFVSASLILIGIGTMHLMIKSEHSKTPNELLPRLIPANHSSTDFFFLFSTSESVSNLLLPNYDHIIREVSTVICLLIIVLNCFCVLIFSIEIYLGSNMTKHRIDSSR